MSRRRTESRERIFSCTECGTPYHAYPPDDIHTTASLDDPKDNATSVKIVMHDCERDGCHHPTKIYWYDPKIAFRVG